MTTPYIRLTTDVLSDPKILAIGPEAFMLWVRGLLYSKLHLTDGFVPRVALPVIAPTTTERQQNDDETTEERRENDNKTTRKRRENVAKLIRVGLWQKVEGGWTIGAQKWARYQITREEIETIREGNRERVRRFRERKRNAGNDLVTRYSNECNGAVSVSVSVSEKEEDKNPTPSATDSFPELLRTSTTPTGHNGTKASPKKHPEIDTRILEIVGGSTHFAELTKPEFGTYWQTMTKAYIEHPSVFLSEELVKADSWLAANPRRKPASPRGFGQFLRNWMDRAVSMARREEAKRGLLERQRNWARR